MGWEWGGKGDILALLKNRPVLDLDVEEVQLLVPLHDLAALVDPQQRVLDLLAALRGLVHADVNGQLSSARLILQPQHELGVLDGLDEGDGLGGGGGDVVGGFGQEEGLRHEMNTFVPVPRRRNGAWSRLTLAPAATAFWTRRRHCARLCAMLAVEHI